MIGRLYVSKTVRYIFIWEYLYFIIQSAVVWDMDQRMSGLWCVRERCSYLLKGSSWDGSPPPGDGQRGLNNNSYISPRIQLSILYTFRQCLRIMSGKKFLLSLRAIYMSGWPTLWGSGEGQSAYNFAFTFMQFRTDYLKCEIFRHFFPRGSCWYNSFEERIWMLSRLLSPPIP